MQFYRMKKVWFSCRKRTPIPGLKSPYTCRPKPPSSRCYVYSPIPGATFSSTRKMGQPERLTAEAAHKNPFSNGHTASNAPPPKDRQATKNARHKPLNQHTWGPHRGKGASDPTAAPSILLQPPAWKNARDCLAAACTNLFVLRRPPPPPLLHPSHNYVDHPPVCLFEKQKTRGAPYNERRAPNRRENHHVLGRIFSPQR